MRKVRFAVAPYEIADGAAWRNEAPKWWWMRSRSMADGPLAGFRILDLTQVVSGPFCTMQLGDLGADVIKIEPPGGDTSRQFGRPTKAGVTATFLNFNRNKRSIVVDLKKEHG